MKYFLSLIAVPSGLNGIVPSYLITDLNARIGLGNHFHIQVSLNNLADKRYYTRRATGYPGPGILPSDGRSFVVSLGAKF